MNLVKWLRKNKTKVMALVVAILMVSFLGVGTFLQYLAKSNSNADTVVAYWGQDNPIEIAELAFVARRQLQILRMLQADKLLINQRDLNAILLTELLFGDPKSSIAMSNTVKFMVVQNNLRIDIGQINKFFSQVHNKTGELMWLLLKAEARQAGIEISKEQVRNALITAVPQMTGGYNYRDVVGSIVKRQNISEDVVLEAFVDMLNVLTYARKITTTEDITNNQLRYIASRQIQSIDAEFVEFPSSYFMENRPDPSETAIAKHFEKYKTFLSGRVSEDNPYGFGYKIPDRAKIEYFLLKLDDISEIVIVPTPEETEGYYQNNIHQPPIAYEVPSDTNDPNSEPIKKTKSYSEVADIIYQQLLENRTMAKADMILNDARQLMDAPFEDVDIDQLSEEEYRKRIADYKTVAKKLSEQYKVKIYTGQTGLLSDKDFINDKYLGDWYAKGQGGWLVSLPRIVFATEQLGSTELGPYDMPPPKLYENIGPLTDSAGQQMVALVRIIATAKTVEPNNINEIYNKTTLVLDKEPNEDTHQVYSVKEAVADDLKLLESMQTVKDAANKFVKKLESKNWESEIEELNKLYGKKSTEKEQPEKTFELQSLTELYRPTNLETRSFAQHIAESPGSNASFNSHIVNKKFLDRLDSLLPKDSNSLSDLPQVMEFKPKAAYYVIKSLSRSLLSRQRYNFIKSQLALKEENIQSQSLTVVHFTPENILKRMRFRWVNQQVLTDPNESSESAGAS